MTAQTAAGMVAAAKQRVENLSVEPVEREISDPDVVLVDIRETEDREATGAIAGAVHAPCGMLEFYADLTSPYHRPEFDPDRRVILYCASRGRSALAVDMLQDLGYTRGASRRRDQGVDGGGQTGGASLIRISGLLSEHPPQHRRERSDRGRPESWN